MEGAIPPTVDPGKAKPEPGSRPRSFVQWALHLDREPGPGFTVCGSTADGMEMSAPCLKIPRDCHQPESLRRAGTALQGQGVLPPGAPIRESRRLPVQTPAFKPGRTSTSPASVS